MNRKVVIIRFVLIVLLLTLTGCYGQRENLASEKPLASNSVIPSVIAPQPSNAMTPQPSEASPDSKVENRLFAAYQGRWLDREYNLTQCLYCHAGIDIGTPEQIGQPSDPDVYDVFVTFYEGMRMDRVVDAMSKVRMNQDGVGEFKLQDEYHGFAAEGTIRFQQDQILVDLNVREGTNNEKEIFSRTRTFVKDPYQDVIPADPIKLATWFCGNCQNYTMKLETGVEWHEDLFSGSNLEVVNAWNENQEVVRQFIVNTIKHTVLDISPSSEPRNLFWDSMTEATYRSNNPEYVDLPGSGKLENLLAGLRFAHPQVRWYSAYKISEQLTNDNREEMAKWIAPLLEDADVTVREAAKFTKSLIDEGFESDKLLKSPDGKKIIFYKYREARYNDGNVWMIEDHESKLLHKADGSINHLSLSKDGKWLAIEAGGRTWSRIIFVDMQTEQPLKLYGLIDEIINDPANGYSKFKTEGNYSYLTLKEWSPDHKKALLSYQFNDKNYNSNYGLAVYNLGMGTIEQVFKTSDSAPQQLPSYFEW